MNTSALQQRNLKNKMPPRSSPSYWSKNKWLYILLIPGFLYFSVFKYIPMFGIVIAFENLNLVKGIIGSPWVGLDHFRYLFHSSEFMIVLRNSLVINLYQILFGFPAPLLVALMLNEIRHIAFKRISQTILYLPHFISRYAANETSSGHIIIGFLR